MNVPADDIGALWDAAVVEYNKTAAVEPTLRSYTVEQVLAMTVEKEEYFKRWRNDKGKLDRFRSVLKGCLGPLNALGQFVSANASAVFPPTATICTAVSYIIQTANSVSADYDLLVSFFDELRLFLERLKVIDGHIPNSKDIRRCLVDILVLVLKIMGLSVKTMKKGRGLKFLKNLVGEDEELKRNYDQLEKLVKQEESLMLHQVVANTSETLDRLDVMGQKAGDGFAAIKRMEEKTDMVLVEMRRLPGGTGEKSKAEHLSIIREYLQPKPVIDDYTRKSSHLFTGSATWLLDEPTFRGWASAFTPQILWISGPPGSGKSHLSTFSIQQLLQKTNSVVAYYYFHDNNLDTRSVSKALSAMVFQIARVDEVYCARAAAACKESVGITDATIGSIWEDFFEANYGSSSRCHPLYLVFDGIDEAEREDIVDLLSLLTSCLQRKLKIQVLLVGRPEMDQMVSTLGVDSVAKIEVSISKNSADIMRYITRTYDRSPTLPKRADFRQKVMAALLEGSNGMFLWVDLMFKDLSMRSQPKQILNALKALPKGLDKVYDKILGRVEMDVAEDVERQSLRELFCWVAHSKRPQTQFVLNLIIQFLTEDDLFEVEITIKKHCASLIILTKTGSALLDDILQSDEGNSSELGLELGDRTDCPGGASKPITRDQPGIAPADEGIEDAGDESNEENYLTEKIQQDIVVELLHASLGDYFRNPRAQTTALIYSISEARVRIVISTMRIFCQGGHVAPRLWWFALENWMTQLQDLDERLASDSDTKTIVEYLVQVFYTSKELQQHIVGTIRNVGLEHFEFGYNDNPQHPFRVTVHRWFHKALQNPSIVLDRATSEWIGEVLENPMRLLVPLTRICVSEWLQADGETVWLYWRYRLSLKLLLSTDLVPTFKPSKDPGPECPKFIIGSHIIYVANFFKADRDLDTHCRVARCEAFGGEFDASISEYQKAAQKLIDSDSATQSPILQSTLLELATVEFYEMSTIPKVLDLLNEYLTLDQSNYKAYSCLAVALRRCGRHSEANEALAKALAVEPTDPDVSFRLIDIMTSEQRYMDIITLLETEELRTSCMRIQGNIDIPEFHGIIFYAGLVTGNLKLVIEIYESTIAQISTGTKQASRYGIVYTPESAGVLARRWLALLYQRYAGEPGRALHLYADALLHSAAFWKLGQWHSGMDSEIIPSACDDFAELIYEKANPLTHGKNDDNDSELLTTIKMLERLRARQTASEANTEGNWKLYSQKNINVLLSKLYLRCGRNAEADLLLREQAQRGIDLLQDDLSWNDSYGFQTLSKVLLAYGREDDARISLNLRQIDFGFQDDVSTESGDTGSTPEQTQTAAPDLEATRATSLLDNNGPKLLPGRFVCASGQACQSPGGMIESGIGECAPVMWTCTSCIQVDFCDGCHNVFMQSPVLGGDSVGADEKKKRLFICSPHHEFLKTPAEDWEGMRDDGFFVVAGKERRLKDWLDGIEAEFKHQGQASNAYRMQKRDY